MKKAIVILLLLTAAAQAAIMEVTIANSPPTVWPVTPTEFVRLGYTRITTVYCTATITDLNGIQDVQDVKAEIWHNETSTYGAVDNEEKHYETAGQTEELSSNLEKQVRFEFQVTQKALEGTWVCRVTAYDSKSKSYNETEFTVVPLHCSDSMQNYGEEDVDCGGECPPCPTCFDGILNQEEEGVDCGGPNCQPCGTCFDGILNPGEQDVDCGGLKCPPCDCFDGILDPGEEGLDCGGPDCPPCHCFNGIHESKEGEIGLDCGGVCPACPPIARIPSLNVTAPSLVYAGEGMLIEVRDDEGHLVEAYLMVNRSDGTGRMVKTYEGGTLFYYINHSAPFGLWSFKGVKHGYMPHTVKVFVISTNHVVAYFGELLYDLMLRLWLNCSFCMLLVILILLLIYSRLRKRKRT